MNDPEDRLSESYFQKQLEQQIQSDAIGMHLPNPNIMSVVEILEKKRERED